MSHNGQSNRVSVSFYECLSPTGHCTLSQLATVSVQYMYIQGKKCQTNLRACSVVVFTNPLYTDTELDVSQTSPLCTATELLPVPGPYQALTLLDIWQCWPGREAFVHLTALAASGW